jgi:nucleoside triphosphate pyrophosphatase
MKDTSKLLNFDSRQLILASQSPRRKQLLAFLGVDFNILPADIDEFDISPELPPDEYASTLAFRKAKHIANNSADNALVIGADTIVVLNNEILNKPEDEDDAFRLLSLLSGNTHEVYTGLAIIDKLSGREIKTYQSTKVTFRELESEEIWSYIASGSPMDKAGAYGIQDDFGAFFVSNIEGCYYNIVGLPLELLYSQLKKIIGKE